jgi:hypothetical protein
MARLDNPFEALANHDHNRKLEALTLPCFPEEPARCCIADSPRNAQRSAIYAPEPDLTTSLTAASASLSKSDERRRYRFFSWRTGYLLLPISQNAHGPTLQGSGDSRHASPRTTRSASGQKPPSPDACSARTRKRSSSCRAFLRARVQRSDARA